MYLVQYRDPRDPLDYRVRQYDLRAGVLRDGAIVDQEEPDEKMSGVPVSRVTSRDGATVYTLYGGQPSVQEQEVSRQPLGPAQDFGESLPLGSLVR